MASPLIFLLCTVESARRLPFAHVFFRGYQILRTVEVLIRFETFQKIVNGNSFLMFMMLLIRFKAFSNKFVNSTNTPIF